MTHRLENTQVPMDPDVVLAALGLHAGYRSTPQVLDCASVSVSRGRRLALLGANGSGKTTLLRCLSGAHKPTRGTIVCLGNALAHSHAGLTGHRQRVQLVLQDPDDQLFSADVYQDVSYGPMNLGLPVDAVRERVASALAALEIVDLADRPVHHLSFGQRKRVAIAGALAMHPAVLLLDEPTAGLDPAAIVAMRRALDRLEALGTTVVLSTHDVDLAWSWADEVAVVVDGVVHQDVAVKALTDRVLLERARLGLPWPAELLSRLGHEIDPLAPPRSVDDVARMLR